MVAQSLLSKGVGEEVVTCELLPAPRSLIFWNSHCHYENHPPCGQAFPNRIYLTLCSMLVRTYCAHFNASIITHLYWCPQMVAAQQETPSEINTTNK